MPSSLSRLCRSLALALLAGALGGLTSGCRDSRPVAETVVASRPNVVMVVLCSFRADRLGAMGYPRGLTPFLDSLAAEGTLFENAVSASSWTKPSTTSLLTGLTPHVHGMMDFYHPDKIREKGKALERRVLPESFDTIPAALERAGYDTFCRVNNVHAGEFFGLTRGCQDQVTRFGLGTDTMVDDLAGWLAGRENDKPFFAYLFTRHVHTPYHPPYDDFRALRPGVDDPPRERFHELRQDVSEQVWRLTKARQPVPEPLQRAWTDLYDAQIPALDRILSRIPGLLEQAGAGSDTLIVVTGDHGDRFFENGEVDHGGPLLDQAVLHIPLLAWGAGVPAGQRVAPVVRSIDLFPTLLDLTGAEPPAVLQGESLVPLIWNDGQEVAERAAYSRSAHSAYAVRLGRYKLRVQRGQEQALFDLVEDPWEQRNLYGQGPETTRRLRRELRRWLEEEKALAQAMAAASTRELTPEVIEELRALGYL